jgi:hypothetical protein
MIALFVFLAQTCVSEISFQPDPQECIVMWEVNYRNARRSGIDLETFTRKFNAYWKNPNRSRPWIQHLNAEATEPHLWPKSTNWQAKRRSWQRYLRAAQKFLDAVRSGRHVSLCPSADDYGGRCDDNGKAACDPLSKRLKCVTLAHCLGNRTLQQYWSRKYCRRKKGVKRGRGKG